MRKHLWKLLPALLLLWAPLARATMPCSICVLKSRPDVARAFNAAGDMSNWDDVLARWCTGAAQECSVAKANCGCSSNSSCANQLLGVRPDIAPAYASWGWSMQGGANIDNMLKNWCTIDPAGCDWVAAQVPACGNIGICSSACTVCLDAALYFLAPYPGGPAPVDLHGPAWNQSCAARDPIVQDWCSTSSLCAQQSYTTCRSQCGGVCGNTCTQCVVANRPDIMPAYRSWGWDVSCPNHDAIIDHWRTIDAAGYAAVASVCSAYCPKPFGRWVPRY